MKLVKNNRMGASVITIHAVLATVVGCTFSHLSFAVSTRLETISDVRVEPILSSQWTVGEFGGDKAFNLYTPNNYSCSCGITAGAQIMRYWRAPSGSVASKTFDCWVSNEHKQLTTKGGTYDWDAMPLLSEDCTEASQREALGHLTYDLGVASHVSYVNNRISFCSGVFLIAALQDYFGYASARVIMGSSVSSQNLLATEDYKHAILASLDAGMPAIIGLRTASNEGHQVVVDGYGFGEDGKVYCHVNFGWGGTSDGWYNLIEDDFVAGETGDTYQFSNLEEVAYNIDPQQSGDVISGRVLDKSGKPVPNVTVRLKKDGSSTVLDETATNAKGIYSFRFTGKGKYRVSVDDATHGKAELKISISKEGSSPALASGLDFSVQYTSFLLYVTSYGTVANSWGNNLTLDGKGTTPAEPENPEPVVDPGKPDPVIEPENPEPVVEPENPQPTGPVFATATIVDGYLLEGEKVAGTILVKAGKTNKGESKLTATVVLKGIAKKLSYKGVMNANGDATLTCSGQPNLSLKFGEQTLVGNLGGYTVSGVRNLFTSKNASEVAMANNVLRPWLRVVNTVWGTGSLSTTISAKGKVKVTGVVNDKKVSTTGQALLVENGLDIPVVIVKPVSMAFMLHLPADGGSVSVSGIDNCIAGTIGTLGTAQFTIDSQAALWNALPGTVLVDQLPNGVRVSQSGPGAKWILPKAGKVVYLRGTTDVVDTAKAGDNPSGLKLTYKAKDGSFKGSFKAYSSTGGKLKATAVTVTGVQIGNKGYGTATIKNLGSLPVTIE